MQLQVGGDGQDPWARLISSYSLAKQFPSGEAAHQGSVSTLQRGRRAGPLCWDEPGARPQLPEGDRGADSPQQLRRVSPRSGCVPWSRGSRPQIWQEWKGGDEHPREGGRGSNSGIFRAYEEGQRAGASKPCGFCQVRPSYRSLVCI